MKVVEINNIIEVNDVPSLQKILFRRHGNEYNSFWLSHGSEQYPALCILVKGDLATLSYLPNDESAGYRSIGNIPTLKPSGSTSFSISHAPADDITVLNQAVLPFSLALTAAEEFFLSDRQPQSVQWFEL